MDSATDVVKTSSSNAEGFFKTVFNYNYWVFFLGKDVTVARIPRLVKSNAACAVLHAAVAAIGPHHA